MCIRDRGWLTAKLKMKKIELLAMLGESKDIIDYLQRKGTVQDVYKRQR